MFGLHDSVQRGAHPADAQILDRSLQHRTSALQPRTGNAGFQHSESRTSRQTTLHSAGLPYRLNFNPRRSSSRISIGENCCVKAIALKKAVGMDYLRRTGPTICASETMA